MIFGKEARGGAFITAGAFIRINTVYTGNLCISSNKAHLSNKCHQSLEVAKFQQDWLYVNNKISYLLLKCGLKNAKFKQTCETEKPPA